MTEDPIIFLDIDGVLNRHGFDEAAQSCTIHRRNVDCLNRVLDAVPAAKVVLSSAWRYMVANGAMTLRGFEYLLRTHGVHCVDRVVGLTCPDEEIEPRGRQIRQWLNEHGGDRLYAVLDDGGVNPDGTWHDMGILAEGLRAHWCDGRRGLDWDGAARVIRTLTEE